MDFETIKNKIPNEEQQRYIEAKYQLRELERKEKVSDEQYDEMYNRAVKDAENGMGQVEQFLENHISVSEYEERKSALEGIINEIDTKYGIGSDRVVEERRIAANNRRYQLARIKEYYERRGSNIMRDMDVDALSDEEALREYDRITYGIDYETLKAMLNDNMRGRVGGAEVENAAGTPDDTTPADANNSEQEKIEKELESFRKGAEEIKKLFEETEFKLLLGETADLDVTEAVRDLTSEVGELHELAEGLVREMDAFRLTTETTDFSMPLAEIRKTVKDFKTRLKELKQLQIDKYNARVNATNKLIDELDNAQELGIEKLPTCDVTVRSWRDFKYINNIDYDKLAEVNRMIANAKGSSKVEGSEVMDIDLESEMLWIEHRILELGNEFKEDLTKEEFADLNDSILRTANWINAFRVRLENSKDGLDPEKYNEYLERLNDAEADLAELNYRLKLAIPVEKDSDYNRLMLQLNNLDKEITTTLNYIEALYGRVTVDAGIVFEADLNTCEARLEEIKKEIEEKNKLGQLDKNQYEELMKKVDEIENKLALGRQKVKDPAMFKDVDLFGYLNGKIDGLELAMDSLEAQIEALEKPVKDKKIRKDLDAIFKRLEEEIRFIEETLEREKETDPEKYEQTKERLNAVKARMAKLGKNYRKKCPLLVRAFKSAKEFYKKHKKIILIIAGLAAFAILAHHVIIPAIMHGNIMIGFSSPALRGMVTGMNNLLGSLIGAVTNVNGTTMLASGAIINPSVAATSLLKGLAISGIGTAALVAPQVIAIKKLIEKMNLAELKQKYTETVDKMKKKPKEKNPEEPKKTGKVNTGKVSKKTQDDLLRLVAKYRKSKSKMSLDEFCEKEELTEEEKAVLRYFDSKYEENLIAETEMGRKGKR